MLILNSPDLEVTTVNQKMIVNGEIIDAKEVKKTDNGTLPFFICVRSFSFELNFPVHSNTMSTLYFFQSIFSILDS